MFGITDIIEAAIKATSAARTVTHATGHESSALEEIHQMSTLPRAEMRQEEIENATAGLDSAPAADLADGDDAGIIETVIDWIGNLF